MIQQRPSMEIKVVRETDDFIYYETEFGVGFVASKHAYFCVSPIDISKELLSDPGSKSPEKD